MLDSFSPQEFVVFGLLLNGLLVALSICVAYLHMRRRITLSAAVVVYATTTVTIILDTVAATLLVECYVAVTAVIVFLLVRRSLRPPASVIAAAILMLFALLAAEAIQNVVVARKPMGAAEARALADSRLSMYCREHGFASREFTDPVVEPQCAKDTPYMVTYRLRKNRNAVFYVMVTSYRRTELSVSNLP